MLKSLGITKCTEEPGPAAALSFHCEIISLVAVVDAQMVARDSLTLISWSSICVGTRYGVEVASQLLIADKRC